MVRIRPQLFRRRGGEPERRQRKGYGVIDPAIRPVVRAAHKISFVYETLTSCSGHTDNMGRHIEPGVPHLHIIYRADPKSTRKAARLHEKLSRISSGKTKVEAWPKKIIPTREPYHMATYDIEWGSSSAEELRAVWQKIYGVLNEASKEHPEKVFPPKKKLGSGSVRERNFRLAIDRNTQMNMAGVSRRVFDFLIRYLHGRVLKSAVRECIGLISRDAMRVSAEHGFLYDNWDVKAGRALEISPDARTIVFRLNDLLDQRGDLVKKVNKRLPGWASESLKD